MDEGVDPSQMCQSLVDKVSQSKQLMAITDPEILVLFEDWLEELEKEVASVVKTCGALGSICSMICLRFSVLMVISRI